MPEDVARGDGAHLRKSRWPEAIPWMGPRREYGPYPWGAPHSEYDTYPMSHPDAASIGERYMGDVCPECGVPLPYYGEPVVNEDGERGELYAVSPGDAPVACWHPECWNERQARKGEAEFRTLGEFA